MASLRVLAFDHEGRPIQFDTWLDDLQVFDLASGAATAPPATADGSTRSQWLTPHAATCLAIRNHLPLAECAHFGQHKTAKALYDAVVARYSSPATAALGRLLLPYLFPELSAFTTVEDLISHLRASDARYRAAVLAEFLDRNPPPMYITLYFIVTRLPDSLRSVRDHIHSLDPTFLTVDLLEQHLLVAETSANAVGAARGTPRPPFFEGCSPSPLAPSYASAAAADVSVPEDVGATSASAKRRSSKGKGGWGGGGGSGGGGGGSGSGGGGRGGGGGGGGTVGGSGGSGGDRGGSSGSGSSGGGGTGSDGAGARRVGSGGGQRQQQQRQGETPSPQQLCEWFLRGASGGSCLYVIRTGDRAGQTCGRLHTLHCCFSRLDDAWRAEFGDDVELPRWADLLKSRIAIFDLDFDAILSAMYALSISAEGDCYRCVPPGPGIAAAALGASESGTLPGTAPAEALHTFTLDSDASRRFFRDSTTLTPLPAPVPVRLADPSGGPVVARSSAVLPCLAVPSGSLSGLHLPSFSTNLVSTAALQDAMVTTTTLGGSSLYTLCTEPAQVAASAQVSASGQVAASCSCRLLSHQTLLWHHRLGRPSLPRLRGMHSRLLVSGLPRSLPPLAPSPAPPCLPCVEGPQRPRSSLLLVSPDDCSPVDSPHGLDDYTRYTTVFPLRSKGQVVDVLIPWIRTVRLQLRERFRQDLPVLRLHLDRGGEFSSILLRDFCRGEGILQSFTLPDSPQQIGIAERRIGLVMEVARTSMIHAAAPHFLWPFAVRYAAHQLNLWPRVSLPETSPTLRWTGEVGDASVFWNWGSRAFVRDTSADKLSPRAIPCVFLGFVPDVPGWQFYHPTSRRVTSRLTNPLPGPAPVQVANDTGAARGAASGGAELGGAESEGAETGGAEPGGVETGGAELGGVATGGPEPEGVEPWGVELEGAVSEGAESGGAEPQGAASSGGSAGASPRLSPQQLREWFVRRTRLRSGASRARGAGTIGAGGTGVAAGAGGAGAGDLTESSTTGAGGAGAGGAGVGGPGTEGAGVGGHGVGGVELLDFAAACRLDYATALVAESASASPPSIKEAITGPYSSQWQAAMDAEMASWKSTGTYVDEVPPPGANVVDDMWIFRVIRPPGSPPAFKARYVARGFSQRQGVDYFLKFSLAPKMTTLRVLLHVAAQRDYELHSLDFSTAFLQGSLHEEIWLRRPPGFTGSFPAGTHWSLRRPVYSLHQAPRVWHDTLRTTLAALGFTPSTADPSLFLRTDTSLPPFYVLVYVLQRFGFHFSSPQPTPLSSSHSLSAPPSDESVEPSGPYPELVGCLITSGMRLVHGGRGPVVLTGHADASWVDDSATQRSSQGYTFSLGSGSVSWRSARSSSVLSSSFEAEIYAGAMAAQELRWLTYLLTDLGEQPRSPPQRGQLRLAYVATRANTADVFTKALPPACFAFLVWSYGRVAVAEQAVAEREEAEWVVAGWEVAEQAVAEKEVAEA
ncbi:unnamed protein product [Closterium sp. NIES-53]